MKKTRKRRVKAMELAVIALALWVSYKWGQKEAYKRGFQEGVKKAKNYELEVKVKEKK